MKGEAAAAPFCFPPSAFFDEAFDRDTFIASCRERAPLENIMRDLGAYQGELQQSMVALINKDYADFVSLSSNLVGLDPAIVALREPLASMQHSIGALKEHVDAQAVALATRLRERAAARDERRLLQRLLSVAASVDKIEGLLGISGSRDDGGGGRGDGRGSGAMDMVDTSAADTSGTSSSGSSGDDRSLERVAGEFNQLKFVEAQCGEAALIRELRPRIAAIATSLSRGLTDDFAASLAASTAAGAATPQLLQCLRTYHLIQKSRDVECLFGRIAVAPMVSAIVVRDSFSASGTGLSKLYARIIDWAKGPDCAPVVAAGRSVGADAFDFYSNAVWPAVAEAMIQNLKNVFSAGAADAFHANYTASVRFMAEFEALCGTRKCVKSLRASPAMARFWGRWSLPVYFQLRFQEIAGAVEAAIGTAEASAAAAAVEATRTSTPTTASVVAVPDAPGGSDFTAVPATALIDPVMRAAAAGFARCFAPGIFLPQLLHRFWKLALQLLSRVAEHVRTHSDSHCDAPARIIQARVLGDWACAYYQGLLADNLAATTILGASVGTRGALAASLASSRAALAEAGDALRDRVCARIAGDSAALVERAEGVLRQFRHTNRDAPKQASSWVGALFKGLDAYLSQNTNTSSTANAGSDARTYVRTWAAAWESTVSPAMSAKLRELLQSVRKTEDSLQRLKQRRQQRAGTANTLSDGEKIRRQFALDVDDYAKRLSALGLEPARLPGYSSVAAALLEDSAGGANSNG